MFASKPLPTLAACLLTCCLASPALADNTNGYGVGTAAVNNDLLGFLNAASVYRVGQDASFYYSNVTDTPPVQSSNCPFVVNPDTFCSPTLSGTNSPSYNLTASSNASTLTTGAISSPASIGQARATTSADLSTGQLSGSSSGDYARQGYTTAGFTDRLTFSIAGATPTTVTTIAVSYSIVGSQVFSGIPFAESVVSGDLRFGDASATVFFGSGLVPTAVQGGWVSGSWGAAANASDNTFTGVFALVGATPTLDLRATLGTRAASESTSDYGATFQMGLPSNVTYTSASGVFLSATPVPEPGTWVLMLAGMGSVLMLARRRQA